MKPKAVPFRIGLLVASCVVLAAVATAASAQTERSAEQALTEARAAADTDRHEDAIPAYREALGRSSQDHPDWHLELADQLTWASRLDEAVPAYEAVIASGREDLRRKAFTGLGRALSWRGDYAQAVEAFDKALAMDPQDWEAGLLRAQTLSWDHRQAEAEAAYRTLLAQRPGDESALLGLARVLTWRGRYREALAMLNTLPNPTQNETERVTIEAEAYLWMGRSDLARRKLESRIAAAPEDNRARSLLKGLERDQRGEARLDLRRFFQSDGLDIRQVNLGLDLPVKDGRGRIGPRLAYAGFDPPPAAGDYYGVTRFGLSGGYRVSNDLDFNGAIGVDTINGPDPDDPRKYLTYDVYATIWPSDRWRVDLGTARYLFDSEPTLSTGLHAERYKASGDFLATERTRLSARAAFINYSDGNEQAWWQVVADHRVSREPRIYLGLRCTGTNFLLPWQPGYFSPDEYYSVEAYLRLNGWIDRKTNFGISVAPGGETEIGGTERFILSGALYIRRALSDRFDIEAAYDFSSSRTASVTGFAREIVRLTLVVKF